jgi:hypothetical protein
MPQSIDVRRFQMRVTCDAGSVPTLIVGQHEQNVGAICGGRPQWGHDADLYQANEKQQKQATGHVEFLPAITITGLPIMQQWE